MIITLITVVVFVFGVAGRVFYNRSIKDIAPWKYDFFIDITTMIILVVFGMAILFESPIIIISHSTVNKDIYEYNLERESIVKQAECVSSEYENITRSTVIANIYEWNKKIHSTKYWAKNPWTSWFYSQKFVDSLEYIELVN